MFKKLKDYLLLQQRQRRRAKGAKRQHFSDPIQQIINQFGKKIDDQFQYQQKINQEVLKQLQNLNQPKKIPPKQPIPKVVRITKPKVVKAKVHRPKPLPKGPKTD